MRVAIISSVRDSWDTARPLLSELSTALAKSPDIEGSIWLVDDGATDRPVSWNALEAGHDELHVLELQGRQGRDRAFAAALGYLICEREESFDAYLLLDARRPQDARNFGPLFEAFSRHPGSAVLAPGCPSGGLSSRLAYRGSRLLLRTLCGASVAQSPLVLLPPQAAETLCQSCHSGSHVEAALLRLRVPSVQAAMPKAPGGHNVLAAASVFRELAFARAFSVAATATVGMLVATVALAALSLTHVMSVAPAFLAASALLVPLFGILALLSLLLGLFSHGLNETRRWTPALDSALLVRAVTRVKRQPFSLTASR